MFFLWCRCVSSASDVRFFPSRLPPEHFGFRKKWKGFVSEAFADWCWWISLPRCIPHMPEFVDAFALELIFFSVFWRSQWIRVFTNARILLADSPDDIVNLHLSPGGTPPTSEGSPPRTTTSFINTLVGPCPLLVFTHTPPCCFLSSELFTSRFTLFRIKRKGKKILCLRIAKTTSLERSPLYPSPWPSFSIISSSSSSSMHCKFLSLLDTTMFHNVFRYGNRALERMSSDCNQILISNVNIAPSVQLKLICCRPFLKQSKNSASPWESKKFGQMTYEKKCLVAAWRWIRVSRNVWPVREGSPESPPQRLLGLE